MDWLLLKWQTGKICVKIQHFIEWPYGGDYYFFSLLFGIIGFGMIFFFF